jgi:hypothetical protein
MGLFKRKKWEELGVAVTSSELQSKLEEIANTVILRDARYRAIPYKDFEYLFSMKREESPDYKDQKMDCDDHCILFMADIKRAWNDLSDGNEALAFGFVEGNNAEGNRHAWIWQLDDSMNINYIEAQSNRKLKGQPKEIDIIEG